MKRRTYMGIVEAVGRGAKARSPQPTRPSGELDDTRTPPRPPRQQRSGPAGDAAGTTRSRPTRRRPPFPAPLRSPHGRRARYDNRGAGARPEVAVRNLGRMFMRIGRAASLVLFVVVCGLWGMSHVWADHVWRERAFVRAHALHTEFAAAWSLRGTLSLVAQRRTPIRNWPPGAAWRPEEALGGATWHGQHRPLGDGTQYAAFRDRPRTPVRWGRYRLDLEGGVSEIRGVTVDYWLLALVTGAWPAWRGARLLGQRRRHRRAARAGRCLGCGYDLRATPERCPECGLQPIPAGAARP
jgi:hypothetical protein